MRARFFASMPVEIDPSNLAVNHADLLKALLLSKNNQNLVYYPAIAPVRPEVSASASASSSAVAAGTAPSASHSQRGVYSVSLPGAWISSQIRLLHPIVKFQRKQQPNTMNHLESRWAVIGSSINRGAQGDVKEVIGTLYLDEFGKLQYRSKCQSDPSKVNKLRVIKLLDNILCPTKSHDDIKQVMMSEVKMLQRLPGYGVKEAIVDKDNFCAIIFRRFPGRNIIEEISTKTQLYSLDQVLKVFLALAKSLQAIEQAGILHNDVKPENCVVDLEKGVGIIVDFGMAVTSENCTGPLMGTPISIAPELWDQYEADLPEGVTYEFKNSVWSLARILIAMLLRMYVNNVPDYEWIRGRLPGGKSVECEVVIALSKMIPTIEQLFGKPQDLMGSSRVYSRKIIQTYYIIQQMSLVNPADRYNIDTAIIELEKVVNAEIVNMQAVATQLRASTNDSSDKSLSSSSVSMFAAAGPRVIPDYKPAMEELSTDLDDGWTLA